MLKSHYLKGLGWNSSSFLTSLLLGRCWQWTGNFPMCKCMVTAAGPTEEILLHAELGVSFHHCWWGWFQGHYQGDAAASPLTSKRSQSPETVSYSLKVVRTAKIKHPKTIRNLEWNKRKKHSIVTALCICTGHVGFDNLGVDLQWMATSHPWAVRWVLMKIKCSQPEQAGSGNQEIMARS